MPELTEFQRANLKNHLISKFSVVDPATGELLDWDSIVEQALSGVVSDATLLAAVQAAITEAMLNVATDADLAAAIATALDSIELGDTFLQTFVTELVTVEENNTLITQITQNSTFVTNVTYQITSRKGIANELATLGADAKHTPAQIPPGMISVELVGGAEAIAVGLQADLVIPFACTLTGWTLVGSPLSPASTGSIVIDIWKDTYANFPPTVADTITGASKPTIAAAVKAQDADIADWSGEAVAAGSILRFNVDSCTTLQRVTLSLTFQRT